MTDSRNRKGSEKPGNSGLYKDLLKIGTWEFESQNGVFLLDAGTQQILSTERDKVLLEDLIQLIDSEERNELPAFIEGILSGRTIQIELALLPENGKGHKSILLSGTLKDEKKRIIQGVIQDVTHWKKKEDELIRAREKAEESDRMKTVFLTNLSHELRTPMNTIIGFSELINIGNIPPEKRKEYSRIIRTKGQSLLTLIDDIIEIAQFEEGQTSLSVSSCDLNHLFGEVYQLAIEKRRLFQKEAIQLRLDLPPVPLNILTDPGRVQQVCLNLIENSLQFTEKGTIEFGYELRDPRYIHCFVKDTGIGLKKDEQKNIFNRFRKVEETSLRKNSGSGLGLTLSRYIVQLLGGKISVESVYGAGSTFIFTLPNNPAPEVDNSQEALKEQDNLGDYNWKNKVILLVEDDDINVQFIDAVLSPYQVQLIRASNGLQGVELCRSLPQIDLILMDIKMPDMSGYDACREIKKFKPNLPIIAQTAFALRDDRQRCLDAGCDDYLSKPIDINELLQKIQQFIL